MSDENKTVENLPKIPTWAKWLNGQIVLDMDVVYPKYLDKLGLQATQFSTGVIKLCITRDIAEVLKIDGLQVVFKGSDKWKLCNLPRPEGEGDHDMGMKYGGKFRARIMRQRAVAALVLE